MWESDRTPDPGLIAWFRGGIASRMEALAESEARLSLALTNAVTMATPESVLPVTSAAQDLGASASAAAAGLIEHPGSVLHSAPQPSRSPARSARGTRAVPCVTQDARGPRPVQEAGRTAGVVPERSQPVADAKSGALNPIMPGP